VDIECRDFVSKREACGRNLQIMCSNDFPAGRQLGPDPRMDACLGEVKRENENRCQNLFDMLLASRFAPGVLRALHPVQKFGRGYGRNNRPGTKMLPQKTRHVESPSLVCNQ